MSASTVPIPERHDYHRPAATLPRRRGLDFGMISGVVIAVAALVAGIAITGVSARYFFHPSGALIVLGGTLGVMLITTPPDALLIAFRRTLSLFSTEPCPSREELIEEIVSYAKVARSKGVLAIEPGIDHVSHSFLREALLLAMDAKDRADLRSALENKIWVCERQSASAARVLEVAGSFAPTIGVMSTAVGLIDVLRQFSNFSAIAYGVGIAFTSTIYGLALANLLLLPAAHRIRAKAAETLDLQELMTEGTACLFDGMHSMLVRQRLTSFLYERPGQSQVKTFESALEGGQI